MDSSQNNPMHASLQNGMDSQRKSTSTTNRSLNILLVAPWLPEPGSAGVQSSAGTLSEGLSNHHNVTILTPLLGSTASPIEVGGKFTVYRYKSPLPFHGRRLTFKAICNWLISLPVCIRNIRRLCKDQDIDVIHLYQLQMGHYPISVYRSLGGPPLVGTFHGRDAKEYPTRPVLGRWLVRQVTHQTSAFTAVSRDLAGIAEGIIPGVHDVKVVTNGVSTIDREKISTKTEFTARLPERFFLSVGRLYPLDGPPVKGHDLAIRAWGTLKPHYPDLHLVIMGEAAEEKAYREFAEEHRCSELVHILGSHPRSDVLHAMHKSLGIITVSRHEGGGPTMTVLEAGALAKPVIASDIPAYNESLTHEQDSLIVPTEDVDAIVLAVKRLLEDPAYAQKLGSSLATLVATRYTAEHTADRYAEVYCSVMAAPD